MSDVKIRAAVLTVSDTRTETDDSSGRALRDLVGSVGGVVASYEIVTDDLNLIADRLSSFVSDDTINLVLTTGGTGLAPRDNTPEATLRVIEREAPGISELMRAETARLSPKALLSRGVSGIANSTLIINLPGSERGVRECFDVLRPILQHAINQVTGQTKH